MFEECKNAILRRYDSAKESVKALAGLSSPQLKRKVFLFAADMVLTSGDVDEDEMLEAMQRVLDIDDATASKIVEALTYKYEKQIVKQGRLTKAAGMPRDSDGLPRRELGILRRLLQVRQRYRHSPGPTGP